MSSVFGKKHEENEDEEEVGWRCLSLFGCKPMSHDGLLMREMNMIEGFKHVAPYWSKYWKETSWWFSASSNFLENHHHFWGDQVTVFFFLKIFQGRNKGGFLCGLEAAALVPSEPAEELLDEQEKPVVEKPGKRWQTWQHVRREGLRRKLTEAESFLFQTCLFEILRKFETDGLEICTLTLQMGGSSTKQMCYNQFLCSGHGLVSSLPNSGSYLEPNLHKSAVLQGKWETKRQKLRGITIVCQDCTHFPQKLIL